MLNVFPYQVQSGTILVLGLYLNGRFAAAQNYTLTGSYIHPATILGNTGQGLANFSNSRVGFTVSLFPIKTIVPMGAAITVTAWVSAPVWVQIDTASLTHSYETSVSTNALPAIIVAESGSAAPYTLSVELESHES